MKGTSLQDIGRVLVVVVYNIAFTVYHRVTYCLTCMYANYFTHKINFEIIYV